MYDIFDDIFDDGYGYNDNYGMSDTDVEVQLAFEAAMGSDSYYDYDYDYATEGFKDFMSGVGTKIADSARNMVRKIGEMFRKIGQFVTDRLAPLRAKATSSDNKALQQVLKSLDQQVARATGPRKAEIKQKVARVKRAIMQSIDAMRSSISIINRALSDGVSIFKAAQSIGKSFIEKMNAAVADGSEKGNNDDGNDLIDKMNNLERRYASLVVTINNALDPEKDERVADIIREEMPGSSERLNDIIKAVKFDKVDFRAIFAAEAELRVTCKQGEEASKRLTTKLDDKYATYKKDSASNRYRRYDDANIEKDTQKFDETSRQYLSALIGNWSKFTELQSKMSKDLIACSGYFKENGTVSLGPQAAGGARNQGNDIVDMRFYTTNKNSDMYNKGVRSTGRYVTDSELPTTHYEEPTRS